MWDSPANRWDLSCSLVFACTLVMLGLSPGAGSRSHLVGIGCVAAMGLWYGLIGHHAILRNGPKPRATAVPYLAGQAALLAAAQSQLPVGLTLTFLLYALNPQFFMAFPPRRAFLAFVGVNLIPPLFALARHDPRTAAIVGAAGALGVAHSSILGGWINQIIAESRERHHLIGQLKQARAELAEAHRRQGALEERQRMAGEIHDTLAQGFSSILMLIQAAEAQVDPDPEQACRQLGLAARTARENLAEARALVASQGPSALDSASLSDALGRLTGQLDEETGIRARYRTVGEPRRLPTDAEITMLRAAQEALANVRKHARADTVDVVLTYAPESVRLDVADDGVGFPTERARTKGHEGGFGLVGMQDRVGRVGGRLSVDSSPGDGTRLRVEIAQ
ncbi:Signal transduction histidine kinase [Streptacidiphilus jiangxiensis]|uniref:Signal transduction histidine kinase n=1 Tax=Streptacidiphilus jiangxiensis TaxID=235985 RepID=A0A1H7PTK2_STRJI|nr:Signal transduction histidine kinase [Streptacidiphilus jiangxiensis]